MNHNSYKGFSISILILMMIIFSICLVASHMDYLKTHEDGHKILFKLAGYTNPTTECQNSLLGVSCFTTAEPTNDSNHDIAVMTTSLHEIISYNNQSLINSLWLMCLFIVSSLFLIALMNKL